jgi:hypothetical protein
VATSSKTLSSQYRDPQANQPRRILSGRIQAGSMNLHRKHHGLHPSVTHRWRPTRSFKSPSNRCQLERGFRRRTPTASRSTRNLSPTKATWAKLSITVERSDGGIVEAEIIRPCSWILRNGVCAGRMLPFNLPELEVSGLALVTAIDDCPPIADGEGSVVTARFVTVRWVFDPSVKSRQSIPTGRRPMLLWPSRLSFSYFTTTAHRYRGMGAAG